MTTLEILHWNDVHGRYDAMARAAHRAKRIKAEADHPVLLFDAGDIEESSVRLSALTYGAAGWSALRAAGVDVAVPGNGGLMRYGPDVLPRYAEAFGAAPVLANLGSGGEVLSDTRPYRIVPAGDLRVAVIGISTPVSTYEVFGIEEFGLFQTVARTARAARADGADVVIVLSHCGIDLDRALSWDARGDIDLIVGGHTHTLLPQGEVAGAPIVQAGNFAEHLGRVTVEVRAGAVEVTSMTVESVDVDWPQDEAVLASLERSERELAAWLAEPVGRLVDESTYDVGTGGAIATLLADAILAAHPADACLVFPVNCDAGLPAGVITRGQVWAATSSPGNAATATVSGATLREMVRIGYSPENADRTPRAFRGRQLGTVVLRGAELRDGEVLVAGRPVEDSATYVVAGTDTELSAYGRLVGRDPADLKIFVPQILPEILEAYLHGT